jgi:UDP-3-O-[3-hydroxymyristoyl] glucosamine N-acyltransferase
VQLTAREIADLVGGTLSGNPAEVVTGVAGIREAQEGDLTFVGSPKYLSAVQTTRASVIIVARSAAVVSTRTLLLVDDPTAAFFKVVERVIPPPMRFNPGIDKTAQIAAAAKLGKNVSIQPFVVIEDGVMIGDNTVIGAGSYIGHQSRVGADCVIYPRVTLRERTVVGNRVILHSGVVLGADGFGYEVVEEKHRKIPQVGFVEIGDDVEIGANSTVDRGRFGKTRIGNGTKIDNLVQVAHNCVIGEHNIICALTGIAGSVITGRHVTMAGQVGVAGHLTIGDKAIIMAQAGVTKDVPAGAIMLGAPAVPHTKFKRVHVGSQRLPELIAKMRELEQQVAELRARLDSTK